MSPELKAAIARLNAVSASYLLLDDSWRKVSATEREQKLADVRFAAWALVTVIQEVFK